MILHQNTEVPFQYEDRKLDEDIPMDDQQKNGGADDEFIPQEIPNDNQ
jgi:hypothetical protein